jgi:hypothetical protein
LRGRTGRLLLLLLRFGLVATIVSAVSNVLVVLIVLTVLTVVRSGGDSYVWRANRMGRHGLEARAVDPTR